MIISCNVVVVTGLIYNNYLNMLFCIHSPLTVVCFKISIHKYSNTSYLFERILLELKKKST